MKALHTFLRILITLPILILIIGLGGCTADFLNVKPSTDLVIPQTLDDIRGLLDNTMEINFTGGLGQMAADEYVFVDYAAWQGTTTATERNSYIWADDIYEGRVPIEDWVYPYRSIFYANNALQSLDDLDLSDSAEKDNLKGWALFIRAYAYHDLVRNFCLAFDIQTADTDLGLPIRLNPRIDEIQPRASLRETYGQIILDLHEAVSLLTPQFQQTNRNRPSKSTAYALLARIHIMMNDFENAELNADNSLTLYNKLIDYNTVSTISATPFPMLNDESLLMARQDAPYIITANANWNTGVTVNPDIINSYHENDLRLPIFFARNTQGNYYVKTGYFGASSYPFHGPAVNELYLVKAECLARRGETGQAMEWLNNLMVKRFKNTETYEPLTATNQQEAIHLVLEERRKELIWRGIRWSDIKRLNKIGANITLRRQLNSQEYTLQPNSIRYAFPIPDDEITRSKIEQNPR